MLKGNANRTIRIGVGLLFHDVIIVLGCMLFYKDQSDSPRQRRSLYKNMSEPIGLYINCYASKSDK